jgi:hypothetical protein
MRNVGLNGEVRKVRNGTAVGFNLEGWNTGTDGRCLRLNRREKTEGAEIYIHR